MFLLDRIPSSFRSRIQFWGQLAMFLISVLTVGSIVVDYGFVLDEREMAVIHQIYQLSWWVYFLSFLNRLVFEWKEITPKTIYMTTFLGVLLLFTALPKFITLSGSWIWLSGFWDFFSNKYVLLAVLALFSLLEVSKGVVSFINKKTNPALLMAVCFAVIIVLGALLLLFPRSTHEHIRLPVVDALFISTSAVCVTGLSTVDIAQTFSLEGQIIIMLLIQIGGLGVMTITSFFAMFFMGGTGLFNQFALRDMVGTDTFSSLISTLLYILGFTFVIELIGACCIWVSIHGDMGMSLQEEFFFSIFHAVSAFCNAGFSTLTGNLGNTMILGHKGFYIVISLLIVFGGISFPILMNFKRMLLYYLKDWWAKRGGKEFKQRRFMHLTNVNTKIVLVMNSVLIVGGMILIALFEWNGAFAQLSFWDKIVHALFNSVVPRTAGFNSVDITQFSILTTIVCLFLMWVGGASQSTAGGIKVNTFAVAFANFMSVIRGRDRVVLFNREITADSVRRASAVIFGSILTILFFFVVLVIMEPDIAPLGLFFEIISAYSTVGLSLNVTPLLGDDSKIWVAMMMFIGRVGMITILMTIVQHKGELMYRCPKDQVIIN
ncbi:MAG: potassium transporter TrkG [Parabacteroides sp.]|nr:potassium transporter TrkG [Parabacteroides sp.]